MSVKKYYWLKLHKDFFKSIEMKKLRRIAGGDTYTIIYLKLQLLSLENNGHLFFEGVDDSFCEELALEINEDAVNVEATFTFLIKVGLIEMISDEELKLTHVTDNIGSETPSASRKRKQRLNKNNVTLSQGSHNHVADQSQDGHKNVTTEIRDKSKEIIDNNTFSSIPTKPLNPQIENLINYWGQKFGDTNILDQALERKINNLLRQYTEDQIQDTITKYHTIVTETKYYYSIKLSLFDFTEQRTFQKWFHAKSESFISFKGEEEQRDPNEYVPPTGGNHRVSKDGTVWTEEELAYFEKVGC